MTTIIILLSVILFLGVIGFIYLYSGLAEEFDELKSILKGIEYNTRDLTDMVFEDKILKKNKKD